MLLRTNEAVKKYNVSAVALRRWTNQGLLPNHRTAGNHHRYDSADIEKMLSISPSGTTEESQRKNHKYSKYIIKFSVYTPEDAYLIDSAIYQIMQENPGFDQNQAGLYLLELGAIAVSEEDESDTDIARRKLYSIRNRLIKEARALSNEESENEESQEGSEE